MAHFLSYEKKMHLSEKKHVHSHHYGVGWYHNKENEEKK